MDRPSWPQYFMEIAHVVAKRSTCMRRQVGAVIVRDKQILSTGYNGAPKGLPHCEETGCIRQELNVPSGERHELCRAIHAEQNAIAQAAYNGVSLKDSTLYCTTAPCSLCAKMIINAGIKKVYYEGSYPDARAMEYFRDAMIEVYQIVDGIAKLICYSGTCI